MSDPVTPLPPDNRSGDHDPHTEPRGSLAPGTPPFFGRYETWRALATGGFGRVYLARDWKVDRFVAVKVPRDPLESDKHETFLREARIIAKIAHSNICPVYDVGVQDGFPYLIMRYVRGGTLNDLIGRSPPTTEALWFAEQIAHGLQESHVHGIFHSDLKPKNILYDEQTDRLLLTDFGISRRAGGTATIAGAPGSPPYMAPEQWDPGGEFGNISGRTDIYSLGVILFQLLTGSLLFHGSADELRVHHCRTLPRKPSEIRPDRVDSSLDELCLKALAKKPSERYVSAREFANAIAAYRPPLPTGAGGTTGGDSTDAEGDGAADTPR